MCGSGDFDLTKKYPYNIYPVEKKFDYDIYKVKFDGLIDLQEFLMSKPPVNPYFVNRQDSLNGDHLFAGISYQEYLESLLLINDIKIQEFMNLIVKLNEFDVKKHAKYKTVKTYSGGKINNHDVIVGNPKCFETSRKIENTKFIKMYANLAYLGWTDKEELYNRAIIIAQLIKMFEKSNYKIDLDTFAMSWKDNEIAYTILNIKKYGDRIDIPTVYKCLCDREFLRRLIFRVRESMNLSANWVDGYGSTTPEEEVKKIVGITDKEIYFGTSRELGIKGSSLADDFESTINHLNLSRIMDTRELDERIEKIKKLKL